MYRPDDELSPARLAAYGLPGLALAALGLPLVMLLPKAYAELPALGLTAVGAALLLARLWDMVSDPLIGVWSDRLARRRRGRKLMITLGLPLLSLSAYRVFAPPDEAGLGYLLGWSLLLYTGWSMVAVPYQAWGAELSRHYHRRTHVTSAREGFVIVGTLLVLALGVFGSDRPGIETLDRLALPLALLLPLTFLPGLLAVGDRPNRSAGVPLRWRQLIGQLALRRLLLAYVLNNAGNAVPAALFLLYVEHVLQRPTLSGWLIGVFFGAGLLGFAVWVPVARRVGKHRAWSLSMLFACAVFAFVPFLAAGDTGLFLLICLLTGLSLGVDMALPASIQADVLDGDRAVSGGERAGLLFGVWGMATKLALALGVGLAFPLVELAGFDPSGANDGPALTALALVYAGLPVLLKLASAGLMWRYPQPTPTPTPIEETDHAATRRPDPVTSDPDRMQQHEAG